MRRVVLIVVLSIAAFAGAGGAQTKRPIELADYYRLETVSDPQISPDGTRVAFVRNVIIEATNTRQSEIWIAKTDGSSPPTRLSAPSFSASAPRWSPTALSWPSLLDEGSPARPRLVDLVSENGPAVRRGVSDSRVLMAPRLSVRTTSGLRSPSSGRTNQRAQAIPYGSNATSMIASRAESSTG